MELMFFALLFGIFSAAIASSKNRSGFGWFIIGLFFGPFGLLVVFFPSITESTNLSNKIDPDTGLKVKQGQASNGETEDTHLDQIKKLFELKQMGAVSEEEFESKKKELLINNKSAAETENQVC